MFWDLFIRRVFGTFAAPVWGLGAAGRVLVRAHHLFPFNWDGLDHTSLSALRQCFPPGHALRRDANRARERRRLGAPLARGDLLMRLASLALLDERLMLARWHLVEVATPSQDGMRRGLRSKVDLFLARLLLRQVASNAFSNDAFAHAVEGFEANPDEPHQLSTELFSFVVANLPSLPRAIPTPTPPWFAKTDREPPFVRASVLGLDEMSRIALFLSFYATLTVDQVRVVMSEDPAFSDEEMTAWLEEAYVTVLNRMAN